MSLLLLFNNNLGNRQTIEAASIPSAEAFGAATVSVQEPTLTRQPRELSAEQREAMALLLALLPPLLMADYGLSGSDAAMATVLIYLALRTLLTR